ncbi:SEC-C metal-binding domain-containing protein [Lientehia hominis]
MFNKDSTEKIYPNEKCPCGSGLKYKKCHGKLKNP